MKRVTLRTLSPLLLSLAFLFQGCSKKDKAVENVLNLAMVSDAKTFDPALVGDLYSALVTSVVYEGLLEYHYLKRPHELQPLLSEAMPQVSKDGLTYTFKIRKGVKFTDHASFPGGKGREVTAKDFVYSFLRVADPKLGSGNFWIFDGHIQGLNEWREKQKAAAKSDFDAPVAGFQATDDQTLVIKLKKKYPQLLFVLAMPITAVVPREVVEATGKDFVNTPVGTGPYKLVNWMRNSRLSFVKNPEFRGQPYPSEGEKQDAAKGFLADAGKTMPFADKLDYYVFVESQPAWLNFLKGAIDASGVPKDNFDTTIDKNTQELLPDISKKGITLQKGIEPDISYTAFNMEDPVIKKAGPNLRKAISMAGDEKKAIDIFFNGRALPAQFIIPPSIAGYDAAFANPFRQFNVEKAKELLAKAGYPNGEGLPELVYEATQGTESRQMSEMLQKELAAIGIKLKINYNSFPELDEKLSKKKAQMWGIAWNADYPDAENFLQLLYGGNKSPGPNASNYDNPEYNKLFEQVREMADSPARRALIGKMREIFVADMPWVPERHRMSYALSHRWLKNYKPLYMGSSPAKFLRIDLEEKKKGLD